MKRGKSKNTIQAIADHLGIVKGTVSKALNGYPRVSPDTRERVIKAANALNYKPNRLAQALKQKQTYMIGVVIPVIRYSFFTDIARSIMATARSKGHQAIFACSEQSPDHEREIVEDYIARCIDGIIILPCVHGSELLLEELRTEEHPVVVVDRELPNLRLPYVGTDFEQGAYMVTKHLIEFGHRRIVYLSGPNVLRAHNERLAGMRKAFAECGLSFDENLVVPGEFDAEDAGRRLRATLDVAHDVTAVLCANLDISIGVHDELCRQDIRVPEEISVATEGVSHLHTSLDQNIEELGRVATQLLMSWSSVRRELPHVKVKPTLCIRGSTAAPRKAGTPLAARALLQ